MNILYIHQHFATPKGSTGTRSYEFARRWVKGGHKVTAITGQYDVGGLKVGRGLVQTQAIDEIDVIIVGTRYSNKQTFIRRIMSFLCFVLFGIWAGLRTKNVDVVYATSTPLTVGIPAIIIKWLKHVPFVFEVRDQWPEIPIEMGIIRNKVLAKLLLWLERAIYRQSATIIALSPGMAEGIRSVIGEEKQIAVIPNSCETEVFKPDIGCSAIREERQWDSKLVLMHFGAIGRANGCGFLVDAASMLKEHRDIHFVLVGEGSEKTLLVERVRREDLKNFEFLDAVSKMKLTKMVAACDVSLVIFANYPILQHNSANKFFDSLSASKPVLLNYSGWQRKILEDNNAGFGCELCSLEQFVERILYLNANRELLAQMGQNARLVAEQQFDRDMLAAKTLSVIESVLCQ